MIRTVESVKSTTTSRPSAGLMFALAIPLITATSLLAGCLSGGVSYPSPNGVTVGAKQTDKGLEVTGHKSDGKQSLDVDVLLPLPKNSGTAK